jgi:membrane-associated phospholipid phosphatase
VLFVFSALMVTNLAASESWRIELGVKQEISEDVFEDQEWNIALFRLINSHHTPGWDKFMVFFDTLGIPFEKYGWKVDIGISWILIPLFILTWLFRRRYFVPLTVGLLLETLCVVILKEIFPQPRPLSLLENVHILLQLGSRSFPSGHTAMMTVIATIMMNRTSWGVKSLWILAVLLISYQRIYTGAHFPLDVATGWGIGLFAGTAVLLFFRKRLRRKIDFSP